VSRPPRVVIDTNVVLSAHVFARGPLQPLREVWMNGRIQPLLSRETTGELLRVLTYPKFALSAQDQDDLIADYLPYCTAVTIPNPPPASPKCRDPYDIPFLQLAVAGKAQALITGDRDLLALSGRQSIRILTAQEFLQSLT
jgi:putative PIN family toxin of toxin-antitoxin system